MLLVGGSDNEEMDSRELWQYKEQDLGKRQRLLFAVRSPQVVLVKC